MWQIGRSANPKCPYFKWLLFVRVLGKLLKADAYILKYPTGSSIDYHKDSAPQGYKHYRLNIVIKRAKIGGEFKTRQELKNGEGGISFYYPGCATKYFAVQTSTKRINFFRPDMTEHAVAEVKEGTRYVLSIGWLVKE